MISLRRHACSIVISVARDYYDVMKVGSHFILQNVAFI